MGQCPCFGAAQAAEQERRAEADRLESQDARARAAEAAQKRNSQGASEEDGEKEAEVRVLFALPHSQQRRQEEYQKSAAGRAARAQMKAMKESKTSNQGEPVLKWQMG